MIYSNINNFFHGIMFHHFHDLHNHKKGQGSISKEIFYKMINFIGKKNILDAKDFNQRMKEKKLKKTDVCLTFDDALKCQYDIAFPILEDLNIKSFFFINSSLFSQKPDLLEIYRYFRTNYFNNINQFYKSFFKNIEEDINKIINNNYNEYTNYIKNYPFYSENDIKFRLIRDHIGKNKYDKIMFILFKEYNFKPTSYYKKLFMNEDHIKESINKGHQIGLHTNSHPTNMDKLNYREQLNEYSTNLNMLINITGMEHSFFFSASYPLGKYNFETFEVLKKLKINMSFIDNISSNEFNLNKHYCYKIPREDHSNILKYISN